MITNESCRARKFPPSLKLLFSIKSLIYDRVPSVYWCINRGIKSRSETQFQRTKYSIIATPTTPRAMPRFFRNFHPHLHSPQYYYIVIIIIDYARPLIHPEIKIAANYPASRELRSVYSSRFLTTHRKKKKNCISSIHSCIPDNGDNIASLTSGSIPNDFYDVILCVAIPTPYKIDPFSRGSNVQTDKYTHGWKTMGTRDTWRERERERVFPENARAVRFIVFVDFENAKLPITPPP